MRKKRPNGLCACGCGKTFRKNSNSQRYVNGIHRDRHWCEVRRRQAEFRKAANQ